MTYNLRFYAVRTSARREKRVAEDITRFAPRTDVRLGQVLFHPKTPGYVYVECGSSDELERVLAMIPTSKGIVGEIAHGEIEELFTSQPELEKLVEYDKVEVSQGPEKGTQGVLEQIHGSEGVVLVEDPIMPRRLTIPLSRLKKI